MKNILLFILLLATSSLVAETKPYQKDTLKTTKKIYEYVIRPNGNIGFLGSDFVYSYGGRVLFGAGGNKSYGADFSYFENLTNNTSFYSVGVMLEMKLFDWFLMGIGTVGYYNLDGNKENYPAFSSNLGWEPITKGHFSPFITYRGDIIFSSEIQLLNALNVGLNIRF